VTCIGESIVVSDDFLVIGVVRFLLRNVVFPLGELLVLSAFFDLTGKLIFVIVPNFY